MRITRLVAAVALVAAGFAIPPAQAQPQIDCEVAMTAYATEPGPDGLATVARVVTGAITVVCTVDTINTAPAEWLAGFDGNLTFSVEEPFGTGQFVCGSGATLDATGPVLVLPATFECVLPTDNPDYRQELWVRAQWTIQDLARTWFFQDERLEPVTPIV